MIHETRRPPKAVILADKAGSGPRQGAGEGAIGLLSVGGSVILERMIRNCLSYGISQFVLILGHDADRVRQYVDKAFRGIRVTHVVNDRYHEGGTASSLVLAAGAIGASEFVALDAKVVFDGEILRDLLDSAHPDALCIADRAPGGCGGPRIRTDEAMQVLEIAGTDEDGAATGAPMGIAKIGAATAPRLFAELARMTDGGLASAEGYEAALGTLVAAGTAVHAVDVTGMPWIRVGTDGDLDEATALFGSPVTTVSRGQQRLMDNIKARDAVTI